MATCRKNNKWDLPAAWLQCVESKDGLSKASIFSLYNFLLTAVHCPLPPSPPHKGTSLVHSDGYLYGRNCSTGGAYIPIGGRGDCESPQYRLISTSTNATTLTSNYKLTVEKKPPGGSAVLLLTFSQPVGLNNVSFSGAVRGHEKYLRASYTIKLTLSPVSGASDEAL